MWRKTRTRYNVFCYGADPNRNWAYQWMNGGASQNPCSDIYAGPRPFSEPSVDVMKDFIASVAENMVAYIDFHSFSQMLLLPFGHTTDHLMNYDAMVRAGFQFEFGMGNTVLSTAFTKKSLQLSNSFKFKLKQRLESWLEDHFQLGAICKFLSLQARAKVRHPENLSCAFGELRSKSVSN